MRLNRDPDFFTIPPGVLRLTRVAPNSNRSPDTDLYLFVGDACSCPIAAILPDEGMALPGPRRQAEPPFRLSILHFNDLHGNLVDFAGPAPQPIFARMAGQIQAMRRRMENDPQRGLLVFSGGDDAVGSVFDALLGDGTDNFHLHAAYRLYSAAGVDACVMGNHDLDLSARLLAQALLADAHFPLLSANLAGCSWLSGLCFPAALFVVKGLRVAVVGLTTPAQIAPQFDSTLNVAHPVTVLQNLLPALDAVSDVRILLSHLGDSLAASSAAVMQAGDRELAAALPPGALHAIVGGHTHQALNEQGLSSHNVVNGIPILQAGKLGDFLGQVDITVTHGHAAVTSARLLPVHTLPIDVAFEQAHIAPLLRQLQPLFEEELGVVDDEPALGADAVRNDFAAWEAPLANFVADALAAQCRLAGQPVDFAILDASALATGLAGGRLRFCDWFAVMPYADTVRLCTLTGAELHRVLMDNAVRADRPGEPHVERGFLHFSREVRYRIGLAASRRQAMALDITVCGRPLTEQRERTFLVACPSFLHMPAAAWHREAAQQAGRELLDLRMLPREDTRLFLRNELLAFIARHGGVTRAAGACCDGRLKLEA